VAVPFAHRDPFQTPNQQHQNSEERMQQFLTTNYFTAELQYQLISNTMLH